MITLYQRDIYFGLTYDIYFDKRIDELNFESTLHNLFKFTILRYTVIITLYNYIYCKISIFTI
ncbi:hypothetical protein RIR_e18789_A0A2N1NPE9_9GLOM [Rhizophagus irregularis DAOM 181602=DAOM 197198]|nr:hypothetical protein RIR_e18789_A0A2N1NPE9_9GLOM [Rhizophagus irregularis DAOM 181602=DAOM 197198]